MKKTEIAMLILIASIAVVIAFFVARSLPIFQDNKDGIVVSTFDTIQPDVQKPNDDSFGPDAINPTVQVYLEGQSGGPLGDK